MFYKTCRKALEFGGGCTKCDSIVRRQAPEGRERRLMVGLKHFHSFLILPPRAGLYGYEN